jgi:hypothetical protein
MNSDDWMALSRALLAEHERLWQKHHPTVSTIAEPMMFFALQLQSFALVAADMAKHMKEKASHEHHSV